MLIFIFIQCYQKKKSPRTKYFKPNEKHLDVDDVQQFAIELNMFYARFD